MENLEKYDKAFMEIFELGKEELNENLVYQSIKLWDSVGHMSLVAALEDAFNIMLEMDDIIDLSSYEKGKEILAEKYGVSF